MITIMYKDLQFIIEKADKEFEKLKFMSRTDDLLIHMQIINIDRLMTTMIVDHNYHPEWESAYERICDNYFEPIRVRSEYVSASEISFSFSYN